MSDQATEDTNEPTPADPEATTTDAAPAEKAAAATRTTTRKRTTKRATAKPAAESGETAGAADVPAETEPEAAPAKPKKKAATKAKAEAVPEEAEAENTAEDTAEDTADQDGDKPKRRRRRGRRGRRGRGGAEGSDGEAGEDSAAQAAPDAAVEPAAEQDAAEPEVAAEEPAKTATKKPATKKTAKKATSKSDDADGSDGAGDNAEEPSDDQKDDATKKSSSGRSRDGRSRNAKSGSGKGPKGDDKVADAIASGGTRMAAKRGRDGGGGGRGRGRGAQRPTGVSEEERRAILDGPPKTMLVSSSADRTSIAVLEDRYAVEHYVTRKKDVTFVGNIYIGRVQNVLPGMEAAFVDIGKGRNGVLYAGEVLYDELDLEEGENPRIEDALKQGQTVLVQVTKDPMGTKGPRLTMLLSLAGRYMVLAPNSDVFGISRKLTDKERDRLRNLVKSIKPDHHGIIVRTAASEATDEALERDLRRLLGKWEKVEAALEGAKPLDSVYEEPPLVVKVIRDTFGPEYLTCIVDEKELHGQITEYLDEVAPELLEKVHLYTPPEPVEGQVTESLFDAYHVSDQLRKAMDRKVNLPSGGYLIIETTEAMKVIDVNTGKFTGSKGSNLEQVVLKTNLEAAQEIVRQLRLRDMGGIIVIDFIDMLLRANQDQVVRKLKRELLRDRTKTRVSDVSRLGLVQMTRKNVSQGLVEAFSSKCDTCQGRGYKIHDDQLH